MRPAAWRRIQGPLKGVIGLAGMRRMAQAGMQQPQQQQQQSVAADRRPETLEEEQRVNARGAGDAGGRGAANKTADEEGAAEAVAELSSRAGSGELATTARAAKDATAPAGGGDEAGALPQHAPLGGIGGARLSASGCAVPRGGGRIRPRSTVAEPEHEVAKLEQYARPRAARELAKPRRGHGRGMGKKQ